MKIYLSFIYLLFFSSSLVFAQNEANVWYFGSNAGLDFNSGMPVSLANGALATWEGCASIADKTTGQLLFYTDGITVYDRNHNTMPNGMNLWGHSSSTQSGVIVPMPGNNAQFYVFTVDAQAGLYGYGGMSYSIVDMTLNGGNGDVLTSSKNTGLLTPTCEKLTSVKHCNGNDIWVITHQWNSNAFYAYLVTSAGINAPVITNIGFVHQDLGSGINSESIGYMKVSPDGTKLALVIWDWTSPVIVELFDFDNQTGTVSNQVSLPAVGGEYGTCFSPDNTKLYVSTWSWGTINIYQYDLTANNIPSTQTVIGISSDAIGALQLGPDGKVYVSRVGASYLGVINDPNVTGIACNYVDNGVFLSSGMAGGGLPDFIENFFIPPTIANFNYSSVCEGEVTVFTDSSVTNPVTWFWDFGDSLSAPDDTSSLQNPAHTFSSAGTYSVTLIIVEDSCNKDTVVKTVVVNPLPTAGFAYSPDPVLVRTPIKFSSTGSGATVYFWDFGDGNTSSDMNPVHTWQNEGTYTVLQVVQNSFGCSDTFSMIVQVSENLGIYLPTAFSPNGDGINDAFVVFGTGIKDINLQIFNRWGERVFETEDVTKAIQEGWDGRRKGKIQNTGVYVYHAKGKYIDDSTFERKGSITLLK